MKYTLQQLKDQLDALIAQSEAGEEVLITRHGHPVVRITRAEAKAAQYDRPPPGTAKSVVTYIAPDFDEPLEDFKEYMY